MGLKTQLIRDFIAQNRKFRRKYPIRERKIGPDELPSGFRRKRKAQPKIPIDQPLPNPFRMSVHQQGAGIRSGDFNRARKPAGKEPPWYKDFPWEMPAMGALVGGAVGGPEIYKELKRRGWIK